MLLHLQARLLTSLDKFSQSVEGPASSNVGNAAETTLRI
jgi:hypothetical protein